MSLDAMKQALEALEEIADEVFSPYDDKLGDAILALRAAIKDQETQAENLLERMPVRGTLLEQTIRKVWDKMPHPDYQKETEQEPMAWFTVNEINEWAAKYLEKHPDQEPRQWQGLTEAEKVNVALDCGCADVAWMDFADALETKLKEKNNG